MKIGHKPLDGVTDPLVLRIQRRILSELQSTENITDGWAHLIVKMFCHPYRGTALLKECCCQRVAEEAR